MSGTSPLTSLLSSTAIALLGIVLTTSPTLANSRSSAIHLQPDAQPIKISQSFRPPSRGQSPPSSGGATRGESCLKGPKQLTSLVPQSRLGLTYSSNPTFYWYVPESPAKTAKFLLLTADDADVLYETTLALPSQPGVVSFKLPTNAPTLEVGKQYHWYLVVGCSTIDQSANPSVEGWVERVVPEATITSQLQNASPREQANIYATNGIWHEAVSTLATLRQTKPTDADAIAGWNELLKSVNLGNISTEPLLNATLSQN